MKKTLTLADKKHDLMSPIASMMAQMELLKRSEEYPALPEKTKESLTRMNEKLMRLHIRLKAFLEEMVETKTN